MIAYIYFINNKVIQNKVLNCIDWNKNIRGNYELIDSNNHHYIVDGSVNFKILENTKVFNIGDVMDDSLEDLRNQLKLTDVQKLQNTVSDQSTTINNLTEQNNNLTSQVSQFGNDLLTLMGV